MAFGLASVARSYGLRFVPVIEEEFALLVDRRAWFEPPMQALLAFCAQPAFRRRAARCSGTPERQRIRIARKSLTLVSVGPVMT